MLKPQISYCVDPDVDGEQRYNIVNVKLFSGSVSQGVWHHLSRISARKTV